MAVGSSQAHQAARAMVVQFKMPRLFRPGRAGGLEPRTAGRPAGAGHLRPGQPCVPGGGSGLRPAPGFPAGPNRCWKRLWRPWTRSRGLRARPTAGEPLEGLSGPGSLSGAGSAAQPQGPPGASAGGPGVRSHRGGRPGLGPQGKAAQQPRPPGGRARRQAAGRSRQRP